MRSTDVAEIDGLPEVIWDDDQRVGRLRDALRDMFLGTGVKLRRGESVQLWPRVHSVRYARQATHPDFKSLS